MEINEVATQIDIEGKHGQARILRRHVLLGQAWPKWEYRQKEGADFETINSKCWSPRPRGNGQPSGEHYKGGLPSSPPSPVKSVTRLIFRFKHMGAQDPQLSSSHSVTKRFVSLLVSFPLRGLWKTKGKHCVEKRFPTYILRIQFASKYMGNMLDVGTIFASLPMGAA